MLTIEAHKKIWKEMVFTIPIMANTTVSGHEAARRAGFTRRVREDAATPLFDFLDRAGPISNDNRASFGGLVRLSRIDKRKETTTV